MQAQNQPTPGKISPRTAAELRYISRQIQERFEVGDVESGVRLMGIYDIVFCREYYGKGE